MIRNLLATTALATIAASGASAAEDQASGRFLSSSEDAAMASSIIGEMVYTSSAEDAESVGEVNDLLVGQDGTIDAAIIGVGGFLGLGEKNVAVSYDELDLTTDDDGSYYVVLETSKEELEAAPAFDVGAVTEAPEGQAADQAATADQQDPMAPEGQPDDETAATDQGASAPSTDDEMAATEEDTTAADEDMAADQEAPADEEMAAADQESMASDEPAMDREPIAAGRQDYEIVDVSTMGADELIGTNVYSYNDENVGDIGDIVLTDDGQIDAVVIDVGGFLGIGEKPVAVAFEDLEVRADENRTLYVYTQFTKEQLEEAPEYNEDEYEQSRDQMRVRSSG